MYYLLTLTIFPIQEREENIQSFQMNRKLKNMNENYKDVNLEEAEGIEEVLNTLDSKNEEESGKQGIRQSGVIK